MDERIINRGDIFWIEQSQYRQCIGSTQAAGRPGIVVSNEVNNRFASTVEIVYLTTAPKKNLPTHCPINSSRKESIALCEQVQTISKEQIAEYVGTCTAEEMEAVDRCICISLGLESTKPQTITDDPIAVSELKDKLNEIEFGTDKDATIAALKIELAKAQRGEEIYREICEKLMHTH